MKRLRAVAGAIYRDGANDLEVIGGLKREIISKLKSEINNQPVSVAE